VSIDVRADESGTIAQHLVGVDDNVVVGGDLFAMELGEGSVAAAPATPAASAVVDPAPPAVVHAQARIPLIKFVGKRSLVEHVRSAAAPLPAAALAPVLDFLVPLPAIAQPMPISEEEMDCIRLGGAF
jgi:pyruvate/2-oxoglutarate dehydrogenase complex dihydrolipoamide acyltransferase (E2) component